MHAAILQGTSTLSVLAAVLATAMTLALAGVPAGAQPTPDIVAKHHVCPPMC